MMANTLIETHRNSVRLGGSPIKHRATAGDLESPIYQTYMSLQRKTEDLDKNPTDMRRAQKGPFGRFNAITVLQ